MNDERQALLNAIIANPDDDAPRLVYADWLRETGDYDDELHADFISLQFGTLKKSQLGNEFGLLHVLVSARYENFLIHAWWVGSERHWLPPKDLKTKYKAIFRRGFLDEIHVYRSFFTDTVVKRNWVANYPITKIVLYDRSPIFSGIGSAKKYRWFIAHESRWMNDFNTEMLPLAWRRQIEKYQPSLLADHPTEQAAIDELSRFCLGLARRRAKRQQKKPAFAHKQLDTTRYRVEFTDPTML